MLGHENQRFPPNFISRRAKPLEPFQSISPKLNSFTVNNTFYDSKLSLSKLNETNTRDDFDNIEKTWEKKQKSILPPLDNITTATLINPQRIAKHLVNKKMPTALELSNLQNSLEIESPHMPGSTKSKLELMRMTSSTLAQFNCEMLGKMKVLDTLETESRKFQIKLPSFSKIQTNNLGRGKSLGALPNKVEPIVLQKKEMPTAIQLCAKEFSYAELAVFGEESPAKIGTTLCLWLGTK